MQKFPEIQNKQIIVKLGSIQNAKLYQRRALSNENLLNQRFYHEQNDYDWFINEMYGNKNRGDDTHKLERNYKQCDDYDNLNTNVFSSDYSLAVRKQNESSENLLKIRAKKSENLQLNIKKMEFNNQGKGNVQDSIGFVCSV